MYLLRYVSFRFYPVFFFLNAEQRERNNHRFLITSAFKLLLFKLLRVESLFCSRSLMKPIRIPREESNPLENVSNSLSLLSLSYSVRKSALFPVLLLSFASFESAFEKNYYSVQTPLLLLLLFVVLVFVLLLKHTNTSNWSRVKKSEFLSRFLLFFFSRANSFSLSWLFFVSAFSTLSLLSFSLSFSLHIFFVREKHTHNINNTRPKIMVRSLYT